VKDNWTWIIGTLVLRFIGVFVVLLFLRVGMYISGTIISRTVKKLEAKKS
jgi:Na+-transporting methylmalonyl-CoA/oxaloacetate decarboxylase gamma subunit